MSEPHASPRGLLTKDALLQCVAGGEIETVLVVFPDLYGRLVGKRFEAHHFVNSVMASGTHACDYLLTVDMEMDPVAGYDFANWDRGYGDFHLVPDLATLRIADWLDATAVVICDLKDQTHQPVRVAPRSILAQQVERAANMGFSVMAGSEAEYYVFRNSYRDAARKGYADLEPAGWYIDDYHALQGSRLEPLNARMRRHLVNSGVPVESTKGEWGLGQHELNLRYAPVLEMADRHTLYKLCAKETAAQLTKDDAAWSVSFMAKFAADRAGSSCHLHLSLWQADANAFCGSQQLSGFLCSDVFRWFLGGWIAHAAEMMVCYAPNVNSYKRFQADSWAPTKLAWSTDNRTAGFRIVGCGQSLRIECRIPGADCNPYLAYAAALASGLDGIAKRTEPPAEFEGNAYQATQVEAVPTGLRQATERFSQSPFARQSFGDDVIDHLTHFFRTEQAAFDNAVTDWERCRYFERI